MYMVSYIRRRAFCRLVSEQQTVSWGNEENYIVSESVYSFTGKSQAWQKATVVGS